MEFEGSKKSSRYLSDEALPIFDETGRFNLEPYADDDIDKLFRRFLPNDKKASSASPGSNEVGASTFPHLSEIPPPPLNVVIQLIGSRGDIQPFIAYGITLKRHYGHRIRLATHGTFRNLVESNGLLFFDIGGDPEHLMSFMVRNPGLLPKYQTLRDGELSRHREALYKMWKRIWKSCFDSEPDGSPFVADIIVANPPSFAHIHCAEKLGIPVHLIFTMPYSPTGAFPHPLTRINGNHLNNIAMNRFSYYMVERLTWLGLGEGLNRFRQNVLHLEPINLARAPNLVTRLKIPHTYCWSPSLLPKPSDWGANTSVAGFFLPSREDNLFNPPADLCEFLAKGELPVYIGFGSIVIDDPQVLTELIIRAVRLAGVRALISKGWLGLGSNQTLPENILSVGDVPHNWLFERVSAVVHHGGAGTTAASFHAGKPSVVVPFFGDQNFWGKVVSSVGAGPQPIPFLQLTPEKLANQIKIAMEPAIQMKAREIGATIRAENGCDNGALILHNSIDLDASRCHLIRDRLAVWEIKGSGVRLSALAAAALVDSGYLRYSQLRILRHREYEMEDRPTDPLSGGALAFLGSFQDIVGESYNLSKSIARAAAPRSTRTEKKSAKQIENDQDNGDPISDRKISSPNSSWASNAPDVTSPNNDGTISAVLKKTGSLSKAVASTPMDFCLGIARGFQNIPIAYGDESGRPRPKVSGVASGVEVGVKEFAFGFYDGITGVVTQPFDGYKKNKMAGFVSGIGKGVGGLILKPGAGIFGLPGYVLQGMSQEIHKVFGVNFEGHIALSRALQGRGELQSSSSIERDNIVREWRRMYGSK